MSGIENLNADVLVSLVLSVQGRDASNDIHEADLPDRFGGHVNFPVTTPLKPPRDSDRLRE
ncbi:MAG: hypothetical protein ACYC0U_05400 [Ilumatobacteraceae bacterium]